MGTNIDNLVLARITERVKPIADAMKDKPTEFELITAIAFLYFKEMGAEIVVLEAGMGGRLDSTNVINTSVLSVITGIALDHTAFLGDTVEKIAKEKAGIIKPGVPVLYGGEDESAAKVIECVAEERGAAFLRSDYSKLTVKQADLEGTVFDYKTQKDIKISLLGLYQPKNASLVTEAILALRELGYAISEESLREGLAKAEWKARFEIIRREPLLIFDGAHNPQGIKSATESIAHYFGDNKVYALTGVLADKDYNYIAGELARVASRAFTITPDNPRALSAEDYARVLLEKGICALPCKSIGEALRLGLDAAKRDGVPLVCLGSLYTYVDLINELKELEI